MKNLAITLCLLICVAQSISVYGQSESRKTNSKSSAGKASVSREQGMNNEAHKLANQYWSKLIKCGRSYFLYSDDRLFEYRDKPHFSFDGQALNARPLSRVETLNRVDPLPIEWDGSTNVSFEVCRMNTSHSELPGAYGYGRTLWDGWGNWTNQHCTFGTRISRAKGKWNISTLKQISCDDLVGWGFTAKPRPTASTGTSSTPAMPHIRSDTNPALASYVVMEVRINDGNVAAITNQTMGIIRRRLELAGVSAFKVERENDSTNGIVVKLPPLRNPEYIKRVISTEARLEIVHIINKPFPWPVSQYATREEAIQSLGGTLHSNRRVLPYIERNESIDQQPRHHQSQQRQFWVVAQLPSVVEGNDWSRCQMSTRPEQGSASYVFCSLKDQTENKLSQWTGAEINEYIGVVLDGEVRAIANIKSQLRGGVSFSLAKNDAEQFVAASSVGPLPAPVVLETEGTLKSFRRKR